MKEVIIGRSRALPGGTTCIWIQALSLSLKISLVYCICATVFLQPRTRCLTCTALLTRHNDATIFRFLLLWDAAPRRQTLFMQPFFLFSHPPSIRYNTTAAPRRQRPRLTSQGDWGRCRQKALPSCAVFLLPSFLPYFLPSPPVSSISLKPKTIPSLF